MNAVAAIYGAAGAQAARAAVVQMLDRMPERGAGHRTMVADGAGVIAAAGASPAFASKAGCALVAGDLRLDNAEELRQTLSLPRDAAHAVIVAEAFARWGDAFAAHLAGDFALVLIDRAGRRLLAVRDPLGIRPLFYRSGTNHLRCASELRALFEPGDAPDEGFLAEVLSGGLVDIEGTPFLSVRRVPAGHMLVASAGSVRLTRYWEPPRELYGGSLAEHAERFREAFDEAVGARCRDHARVGVQLSGGLDSSSVLATMCATGCAEPIAGSLRFAWSEADEGEWISAAARACAVEPIMIAAADPSPHDLASIAIHAEIPDYPTGGPLQAPLQRALKDAGAAVALTGHGGNRWWSGEMTHMADLLRRGRVGALRRWHAAGPGIGEEAAWSWRSFAREGVLPLVPEFLRRGARDLVPAALPPWIDRHFARRVGLRDRLRRRPDTSDAPCESWRRMRWRLDSGEEAFAKERLDRLAVSSGLELRHPFYDRRLVELAFATPGEARIGNTTSRAVMRAAMAPRLAPETVSRTTKADISRVLVDAARAPDVEPYVAAPALAGLGWIDTAALGALSGRALRDGDGGAAAQLWRVIAVEAWLSESFGAR